jgi:dTDP-4-amino-4,6-dideoxygalactose transaminase
LTYNISVEKLAEKLAQAEISGRLPKIVVPVHLTGQPSDLEEIYSLSKKYGFRVIEDASHAIGARYRGELIGNCKYSDITVFSFHPVKIITTAEGGAATTNDSALARKMRSLRSHGITRDSKQMIRSPDGPWYYEQLELGFNYRMTDIQAALGTSQMHRLDSYVEKRREIAARYDTQLEDLPVRLPWQSGSSYSSYHLYVIRLDGKRTKVSQQDLFASMRSRGISLNLHYIPIPRQPFYVQLGFRAEDFPEAESYYKEAVSLPMFPRLSSEEVDSVINALKVSLF